MGVEVAASPRDSITALSIFVAIVTLIAFVSLTPPAASADEPDAEIQFEDFVGAATCGGCHEQQYEMWRSSTHGNAGGAPTRDNVISDFDGTVLQFSDATVTLEIDDAARFLYHVDETGKARQTFEVAGFVGGGHMLGGGTQTSFTRYSDGSWRLLPFDYSRHSDVWFCDAGIDDTWRPITSAMSINACSFWPPPNTFAPNCGNCHSSQMESSFDTQSQQEQVRFMSLAINCESCHGPGRPHVELVQRTDRRELVDIGMEPLELLGKQESVEVCFRCHAMTQKLASGFLPGKPLHDYYALNFFASEKRHGDGREAGFAYQEGHLYSDCFLSGSMTCVDCHDPHSQQYRDIDGFSLPGKLDDGQCTDCHPAKAENLQSHTGHSVDSPGSRCVACHMPFLQHSVFGEDVKFARSDHTIPIPRPRLDASLGLETACDACHAAQPITWQQQYVDQWHGTTKPHKPIVAAVLELEHNRHREFARQALYQDYEPHPGAQLDLMRIVGDILEIQGANLSDKMKSRLKELSQTDDRDARSWIQSRLLELDPDALTDAELPIASRRRIATWLSKRGVSELNNGRPESAIPLLKKSLELDAERIDDYSQLAVAYEANGQGGDALKTLNSAYGAGVANRDEYLRLTNSLCTMLDYLTSQGMPRSAAIDRLCSDENRLKAVPLAIPDTNQ
jgi:hypothetical protein